MSICEKIIITDTNIITDLSNANILEKFIKMDNVFISDLVKNDEINAKTGNVKLINKMKTINSTPNQLIEVTNLAKIEHKLSTYDILNFIIARDNNGILATGDNRLKLYAEGHGIEVIRTLKIIDLMLTRKIISTLEVIKVCNLLIENEHTRIPKTEIQKLIEKCTIKN